MWQGVPRALEMPSLNPATGDSPRDSSPPSQPPPGIGRFPEAPEAVSAPDPCLRTQPRRSRCICTGSSAGTSSSSSRAHREQIRAPICLPSTVSRTLKLRSCTYGTEHVKHLCGPKCRRATAKALAWGQKASHGRTCTASGLPGLGFWKGSPFLSSKLLLLLKKEHATAELRQLPIAATVPGTGPSRCIVHCDSKWRGRTGSPPPPPSRPLPAPSVHPQETARHSCP